MLAHALDPTRHPSWHAICGSSSGGHLARIEERGPESYNADGTNHDADEALSNLREMRDSIDNIDLASFIWVLEQNSRNVQDHRRRIRKMTNR